ncbi:short chain dehydrogenase [Podospora fimiseda]|uniref:Short chain dehydrogenase n=1 Tax=Podospora fimiseda TaxID=252190 RepID=A0AAN6YQC6_9PEZI|nr:short chain dehydrogenase [Podospora fimiseda]
MKPSPTTTTPSALITGCGKGGIGHALAAEFRRHGYAVFATLLAHEPTEHLKEIGVATFVADVTNNDHILKLREEISVVTKGTLDVLVNCAGIAYTIPATDTQIPEVEKMFAVNVFGPMRMVNIFHPLIITSKGKIVNIGSVGGIVPYVYGASYNASKAALHHWGDTLRVEMKPFGVSVVNIISGEVSTNILKRDQASGRKLPEGSVYMPLAKEFEGHVGRVPNTTPPEVYARSVVAEIMKKNPSAWFWTGASTSLVRFIDTFLPRTTWDRLFIRWFGLDALRK